MNSSINAELSESTLLGNYSAAATKIFYFFIIISVTQDISMFKILPRGIVNIVAAQKGLEELQSKHFKPNIKLFSFAAITRLSEYRRQVSKNLCKASNF